MAFLGEIPSGEGPMAAFVSGKKSQYLYLDMAGDAFLVNTLVEAYITAVQDCSLMQYKLFKLNLKC